MQALGAPRNKKDPTDMAHTQKRVKSGAHYKICQKWPQKILGPAFTVPFGLFVWVILDLMVGPVLYGYCNTTSKIQNDS